MERTPPIELCRPRLVRTLIYARAANYGDATTWSTNSRRLGFIDDKTLTYQMERSSCTKTMMIPWTEGLLTLLRDLTREEQLAACKRNSRQLRLPQFENLHRNIES